MIPDTSGIYRIHNKINDKNYVGQAYVLSARATLDAHEHNRHLMNSYAKYGRDNFEVLLVEECPIDSLDEREIYWIASYKSYDPKYGYNKTLGGSGIKFTSETLEAMRQSQLKRFEDPLEREKCGNGRRGKIPWNKGITMVESQKKDISITLKDYYDKHEHPMKGRHHTEESKESNRKAHLRENLSEETLLKMKESHLGKKQSQETIDKRRESLLGNTVALGRIWIHNETDSKMIYPEDLDIYMSRGYEKGRLNIKNKISN